MNREELLWLYVDRRDGRSFNASPMLMSPVLSSSVALTDVTGIVLSSAVARMMREPVTMISSSS